MTQVFFTARELAEIAGKRGITSFPQSERGVQVHAAREGWNDLPSNLCGKRKGFGGGREYHFSILPDLIQAAIHGAEHRSTQLAAQKKQAVLDRAVVATRRTMSLHYRQRLVMEKRSEVLLAIKHFEIRTGSTQGKSILAFVAAQKDFMAWQAAERARNLGQTLTIAQMAMLHHEPFLSSPDGFGLSVDALKTANDRPNGSPSISRSTIYEWIKLRDAAGIAGLAPALTKEAEPVPPGFAEFLKFYARPQKPMITKALQDYLDTGPAHPLTIDQVRHTLKVKLNDIEKNVGREGMLTLRSRLAYIQRDTENLFPTTIYTADGKTFDAEVADPVQHKPCKPEITSILDVATRRCVGFAISRKENASAVAEALRNACVDHGIPAMFYTDRGAGYKNRRFDDEVLGLIGRLDITKMHALPYNSQAKGIIERFNGTVWNPLAQRLPTYLGATMDKEAGWAAHKRTRGDIKEFGKSSLLPSWEDFRAMCRQAIADYNAKPHSALPKMEDPVTGKTRHMSPDEAWSAHVAEGFEPILVDQDLCDDLFRPYEVRIARRALVEWNTNTYFHMALEAYHGKEVAVGYDDAQAHFVWVREYDREADQPGRFICKAEFGGNKVAYVPLTAQRAAEEKRVRGQLKRVDAKRADIEGALTTPFQIDHAASAPMPIFTPEPIAVEPLRPLTYPKPKSVPRTQHPDVELAFDVLADPSQLTSGRRQLLLDLTAGRAGRELLRISGVDLAMLDDLLRSAA